MEKVSSREARRRRLSDRGSERLALITGRIQSLSPDPDLDSSQREDSSLRNDDSVREPFRHDGCAPELEPLLHNADKGKDLASASATLFGQEEPVFQAPPSVLSPPKSLQHEHHSHHSPFTTGEIISAISASEDVRTRCATAAALLVILSYIGFPILGWGVMRGTIIFRPLYLLLLTNTSIVFARLLSGKDGANTRPRQMNRVASSSENGMADQLGRALESGLLLQNIFGALLMDFSIYVVVLICGLNLMP
ncbi:Zinc finger FYVE domain-containing protein 26 isoform 1 [Dorcoceras hygrometricum]|uniref:Zinc finger FYVE domain-containing protein 26 isoform 1 n=1 Tax=Dorcoceras hygrometricum TaxID=472368 RepID=A0A2Z7B075_9LAMI|nr:Zinc finger FYVE domain-containing protein 26 isoform 1 [Dorcoceras hygrometricum]